MADYRRYQPRRSGSSGGSWGRWFVVAGIVVVLLVVGKLIWGGKKTDTTANENTNTGISLITDNTNAAIAANLNSNTNNNTNTIAASPSGSWNNFSTKSCPAAISSFGAAKSVVLTIGFSAANEAATKVFDSLKQAGVPADFLVSGAFAVKNSEVVKSAIQNGYAVYSQSYDSTDLATLTDAEVTSAITKAETAISAATGVSPKPIFRPPSGSYTAQTVALLNQQGYCAVLWTVDAYDWQDGMTVATAKERVMTAVAKQTGGSIVALHAGYDITPELIIDLVATLKEQGYSIITLAALLNS